MGIEAQAGLASLLEADFRPRVSRERLSEQVAEKIADWILTGQLEVGSQLPSERELGEIFGVSRVVVREATRALSVRGLLSVEPGRGSFVQQPTSEEAAQSIGIVLQARHHSEGELLEVRAPLESAIVSLAAQRARPEHLEQLRAALEEMSATVDDYARFVEADLAFHVALAEATCNPLFLTLLNPLIELLQASRRRTVALPGATEQAQGYHREIYQAVAGRDGAAAQAAMQRHLGQISQMIIEDS